MIRRTISVVAVVACLAAIRAAVVPLATADDSVRLPWQLFVHRQGKKLGIYFTIEEIDAERPSPSSQVTLPEDMTFCSAEELIEYLAGRLQEFRVWKSAIPRVVHIADKRLPERTQPLDRKVDVAFKGTPNALLGKLDRGGLRVGHCHAGDPLRLSRDNTTLLHLDTHDEALRDVLSRSLPLKNYSPILWHAWTSIDATPSETCVMFLPADDGAIYGDRKERTKRFDVILPLVETTNLHEPAEIDRVLRQMLELWSADSIRGYFDADSRPPFPRMSKEELKPFSERLAYFRELSAERAGELIESAVEAKNLDTLCLLMLSTRNDEIEAAAVSGLASLRLAGAVPCLLIALRLEIPGSAVLEDDPGELARYTLRVALLDALDSCSGGRVPKRPRPEVLYFRRKNGESTDGFLQRCSSRRQIEIRCIQAALDEFSE